MPPKRAPPSKKGKKKEPKKKKGGQKGKEKVKKIPKKFLGVTFDGVNVYHKPREELEFIAVTLRSQIDKERSERIKFQMERDMFAELNSLYVLRLKELRVKHDWNTSAVNRMNQDVEDQKVIKAQEGKHFRYEAQLLLSSGQMRDEIRRKRLKGKMATFWNFCFLDMADYDERITTFAPELNELMVTKKAALAADTGYIDEVERSRTKFAEVLAKAIEDSFKEIEIMGYFEIASEIELLNDLITRFSNNFEWIFTTAKNYYLDQVHNMLNYIIIMMDHWDEMDADEKLFEEQHRRYDLLVDGMERRQRSVYAAWKRAHARHVALPHFRSGLVTTYVKIGQSEKVMGQAMEDYKNLTHSVAALDDDRVLFQRAAQKCGCVIPRDQGIKGRKGQKGQCCY